MTWNYASTPFLAPSIATVILLLILSIYSWRRRNMPGAVPFAIDTLLNVLLVISVLMRNSAVDANTKIFWHKVQVSWILPIVSATACFILEYAAPRRWLTRRNLILLSVPCLLFIAVIATNDFHHFIWRGFMVIGNEFVPLQNVGVRFFTIYGLCLSFLSIIVLFWLMVRSRRSRLPAVFFILGQGISRGAYISQILNLLPDYLANGMVWIAIEFLIYAFALFGFRILDPVSLAREAVIDQMKVGMLVLDIRDRVVSINPAAEQIVGISADHALGKSIRELLPEYPDVTIDEEKEIETEFTLLPLEGLDTDMPLHYFSLAISLLKEWRGIPAGRLLLLRDVTAQKQAQAQLLAQQWAQATLQEREQLANELHDGISQGLAYINIQAQATQIYLQKKQDEAALASLNTLVGVSHDLQDDIRNLIENLLVVGLPSEGFYSTLRHLATVFEQQNGVKVQLQIDESAVKVCESMLPAPVGVQLIRIVQEALMNVRKHAGNVAQVLINMRVDSGQLFMAIMDDGLGFDPNEPRQRLHFGLLVMQKRAKQIGGQLSINSAIGQGTRIDICAPLSRSDTPTL